MNISTYQENIFLFRLPSRRKFFRIFRFVLIELMFNLYFSLCIVMCIFQHTITMMYNKNEKNTHIAYILFSVKYRQKKPRIYYNLLQMK